MFKEQSMGQTVAIEPKSGTICAPASGKLEMVYETGHAFGMRMVDGIGLLIHIGVDTVNMNGKGFKILKNSGEPVVEVDLKAVKDAGYSTQTMLVITEPIDGANPVTFIDFGSDVAKGQKLTK